MSTEAERFWYDMLRRAGRKPELRALDDEELWAEYAAACERPPGDSGVEGAVAKGKAARDLRAPDVPRRLRALALEELRLDDSARRIAPPGVGAPHGVPARGQTGDRQPPCT